MELKLYKIFNRLVSRAVHRYDMLQDGDRILVGLSGGTDSLLLLWTLQERLARIPIDYTLLTVYIDPGFEAGIDEPLTDLCRQMGHELRIERTDYGILSHSRWNRENPCFLCARLRRKRLFEIADEMGCRKLALGHHKDDIIETFFINMCYAGELSTMSPRQDMFEGRFTIIRPLAYVEKEVIRRMSAELNLPRFENPCPSATTSRRSDVKHLLNQLYASNAKIKGNIFHALHRVKKEYLL